MSKVKNILFITHDNNDFDHFLPLIVHLNKDKKIHIKVLAFYNKYDVLKNRLHKHICDSNHIKIDTMGDICHLKLVNRAVDKIYKYVVTTNFIKLHKSIILSFFKSILSKYIAFCSIILLTKGKIIDYIDSSSIDIAIFDHREMEEALIDLNSLARLKEWLTKEGSQMNNVLFKFAKIARERNVTIIMVPHGPQPISNYTTRHEKLINPFRPDYLFIGNKKELSVHRHRLGIDSTFLLGDPRFDIEWINYLESCALKVYGYLVKKPKDKTVLLYLMDRFPYCLQQEEYRLELHKDILSLVNHFPNLEVWAKHHPRWEFEIPINDFIYKDRQKNIKQFGNDIDTSALVANADICLSASSTALVSPILQKKPVIFYDKWKEKLPDATSIYDDFKFKASSIDELIVQYKKIIDGKYIIDDSYLESFCKSVFSSNCLKESMAEKYSKKIKEIG